MSMSCISVPLTLEAESVLCRNTEIVPAFVFLSRQCEILRIRKVVVLNDLLILQKLDFTVDSINIYIIQTSF